MDERTADLLVSRGKATYVVENRTEPKKKRTRKKVKDAEKISEPIADDAATGESKRGQGPTELGSS
jgi:hypothetical protein